MKSSIAFGTVYTQYIKAKLNVLFTILFATLILFLKSHHGRLWKASFFPHTAPGHLAKVYKYEVVSTTDISQYRLRFGSSLLYKSVFHLNRLTAQLSYEGRAAVEGGK
jgi:hypothetical protein